MIKLLAKKYSSLIFLAVLILFALIISRWLFQPGYFSHHDDLQVMRIYEMRRCFEDLQIPCRWVPDMGYGNGFPLFNYYPVFPYYLGALLSYILGYVNAAKAIFFLPLFFGGVFMYLFVKELFGEVPGLVSGVLYLYAPYRALDIYVRGAVAESFAIALAPLVFYSILKLAKNLSSLNFLAVVFSFAAFLLSHNVMTLFFTPLIIFWVFYTMVFYQPKTKVPIILGLLLGFGMAAFFLLPAFLEKDLVQTDSLITSDLDYRIHFVTLYQLFFDRSWGYGASVWGPQDGISFQIGWPHWWLVAVLIVFLSLKIFTKAKLEAKKVFLAAAFIFIFFLAIFMTHSRSDFLWEPINILHFAQFPWRFLSVAIFSASILGGALLFFFKDPLRKVVAFITILLTMILNFSFFKPQFVYSDVNDAVKLSGKAWEMQQKASILDYLPKTAKEPKEAASSLPIILSGRGAIESFDKSSNKWQFVAEILEPAKIDVPVFEFPSWKVKIGNQDLPHTLNSETGRIIVTLPQGRYEVWGKLFDTPIRQFANIISLVSIVSSVMVAIYLRRFKTL